MRRHSRKLILIVIDVAAGVAAISLAFLIRFAFDGKAIPWEAVGIYVNVAPLIIPSRVLIYYSFGLYGQVWTHASLPELFRILWAVSADSVVTAVIIFGLVSPSSGFPRSVLIIAWGLTLAALGSLRLLLRIRREWYLARAAKSSMKSDERTNTLIFGAGDAGAMLVREFARHPELGRTVVGFVDDDPNKQGYQVAGKPVLGTRAQLEEVVRKYKVTHLVIAVPSAGSGVIRSVLEAGRSLGLNVKTLPGLYELVNGAISVSQIRDVQLEDILGRDEIKVDLEAIAAYLSGETVLVTGAGGSIGSELCRQVATFHPQRLILLGHGENSIYDIHLELRERFPTLDVQPVIADVQDEARILQVFERHRPGVVFHAAAHKHVPLMEQNPSEAIKNNVFGTLNVAAAANRYRVKRFVLISSDKAVNPSSTMGATKRAAEQIIQSLATQSNTVFVTVRFGNVLGSRGSVIPLFKRQIAAGGPVTVTDPRMSRYFMTIPEAVQLVIQAASMGQGGEIFVLDMGKPVRIVDLARDLVRLSGFEPEVDIPIVFTGVRYGEKLFEELLTAEEGTVATKHQRILMARSERISPEAVQRLLTVLRTLSETGTADNESIREAVRQTAVSHWKLPGAVGAGD